MMASFRHGLLSSYILLLGLCILFPHAAEAKVMGDCEVCHGLYPVMKDIIERGTPEQEAFQRAVCLNCHTNAQSDVIITIGGARVPVIFNQKPPVASLAGGNFFFLLNSFAGRNGHNVDGVPSEDTEFKGFPPGYTRALDPSLVGYDPEKPLACAGSNGCHGNRDIQNQFQAIMGAHHDDDTPIDGSTVAKSYRYLKISRTTQGVLGGEDGDWERNASSQRHNEYSETINRLCTNCHGKYHGPEMIGKKSPWLRHPTGVVIPARGEYMRYNPHATLGKDQPDRRLYSVDAPVARGIGSRVRGDVVWLGSDVVMCLSCHVAHASPYRAALRWDYDKMTSGENLTGGCFICHTEKGDER